MKIELIHQAISLLKKQTLDEGGSLAVSLLESAIGEKQAKKSERTKHAREHQNNSIWKRLPDYMPDEGKFDHKTIIVSAAKGGLWPKDKIPTHIYKTLDKAKAQGLLGVDESGPVKMWYKIKNPQYTEH